MHAPKGLEGGRAERAAEGDRQADDGEADGPRDLRSGDAMVLSQYRSSSIGLGIFYTTQLHRAGRGVDLTVPLSSSSPGR
jgi:hypothetical protein